ncbi:Alpha-(1,3)-fucosyltransferase 11 [Actinomortierella wolfii]|nr:Alpha-(1,3)-fucosyltransferase 11 [Actinomortierella wolfii]
MTHRRDMYSKSKVIIFHAQNMPGAYPLPNENDTLSGEKAWVLNSSPYKFYLSFENSNCEDYVTEKLYRPFLLGNVPVVDGPMNYSRFSPTENALIQTDNFANAGMLAKYLKHLDSDDEAYLSHLRYKVPKDPTHTPTLEDLSPSFVKEWYNEGRPEDWGIDGHGANCKICKFAHDLEEGIIKFDASKRIGIDNTCTLNKHAQVIVTNDDDLDEPVPSSPPSSPSPSPSQLPSPLPSQPPSLPDNSPYKIPSTDDSSNIRQSEGSSEGEWMYYFILPVLLFSIAILAVLFSRRLRRAFRNHQQSEDRDVLLDNMQP